MDVASQAITIRTPSTLSKYLRFLHFAPRANINSGSQQRYWVYLCGALDNWGKSGAAIFMSNKSHSVVNEWKSVSDRMAYAHFKGMFCNISVISVYVPVLSANDSDKDKFYAELQLLIKSIPKHNIVIIGRDWNARIGHNDAAMTSTIGKYTSEIGECLLRYAEKHEFLLLILPFCIIENIYSYVEFHG
ncbi:unnamed protein product [Dracunculus medinensis]|uniref:Endo/exonuclease/phosphatase domain-containing protein n=1 Tax=Dracunculus medinensis TaxID=318479 RepID=A0A0N4UBE7_DRAME|nr:unnamed protein product [Dracunculus medinensis]